MPVSKEEVRRDLKSKVKDVFELEVTNNEVPQYLLDGILTKHLDKGPLESIGIWGLYRGSLNIDFLQNDTDTMYNYNIMETRLHGDFRNKKTSFVITTRFVPQDEFSFMQNMFSDVFIRHKFNKNTTITVGNMRTCTGYEGGRSETLLPFFAYSQIGRQLGNIRKVGARVQGKYDLIEYDLGAFSSGTYFREYFPGAEFCGWVNLKPLGKTDGRYGKLIVGGGVSSGRRHFDYTVAGGYIRYNYKKFGVDFEISNADGYNGRRGPSQNEAYGYYTTLYYNLTNKVQLLARYDEFTPNKDHSSYRTREYVTGLNYFIKGQALKLMLNYIFREDSAAGNSHRILIGTQVML